MQELIINVLLAAVIVMAAVFRFIVGRSENERMTKKQKTMLVRILISVVSLMVSRTPCEAAKPSI